MAQNLKTLRNLAARYFRALRFHLAGSGQTVVDGLRSAWRGLQLTVAGWLKRRQPIEPDDVAHVFRARSYPGSRSRQYLVHKPRGKNGQRPRPLVVVLHGCKQDHREIEKLTGFNDLADRHGFYVAYPFITSYRGLRFKNCWGWWMAQEIHGGKGEVEDLWQIIDEICRQYPVNPRRIHVAGLSSGAGMAVAMMVAHANKIASGAAVAGVPYSEQATAVKTALNRHARHTPIEVVVSAMNGEMGDNKRAIPIKIIHSWQDEMVDIQSAINLRDSWGSCFDIDTSHPFYDQSGRVGESLWEHRKYQNRQRGSVVETFFLQGPGHGWYGGNPGEYSYPDAPDTAALIWRFFKTHPLQQ